MSDIATALGLGYDSTNNVMYIGNAYNNVGFQLVTTTATSMMALYHFVNGARYIGSLCLLTPDDTIGMLKVMKTDEGIICDDLYAAPYFPSNKYQASTCVIKINGIEYILPEKYIGSSTDSNGTLPFLLNTGVQATE